MPIKPDNNKIEPNKILTASGELALRSAVPDDFDSLLMLMEEAELRLVKLGMGQQWPVGSHHADSEELRRAIQSGGFVAAFSKQRIVGACILTWEPEPCWSRQPKTKAGYVSKLAVSEQMSGLGVGPALVRWLEGEVARSGGTHVRLDCWAGNDRLIRYYKDAGFEHLGNVPEDDYQVALFEKPVESQSGRTRTL